MGERSNRSGLGQPAQLLEPRAREQDLDLIRRSPYRPAAPRQAATLRPDRRPHSITAHDGHKTLALWAATTEEQSEIVRFHDRHVGKEA